MLLWVNLRRKRHHFMVNGSCIFQETLTLNFLTSKFVYSNKRQTKLNILWRSLSTYRTRDFDEPILTHSIRFYALLRLLYLYFIGNVFRSVFKSYQGIVSLTWYKV